MQWTLFDCCSHHAMKYKSNQKNCFVQMRILTREAIMIYAMGLRWECNLLRRIRAGILKIMRLMLFVIHTFRYCQSFILKYLLPKAADIWYRAIGKMNTILRSYYSWRLERRTSEPYWLGYTVHESMQNVHVSAPFHPDWNCERANRF